MKTKAEKKVIWGVLLLASVLILSASASAICVWSHAERGWYCFNGIDDNCNLLVDAQDTLGCSCMDGKDNNGGGGIDCADTTCASEPYCGTSENIVYCDDGGQNCKSGCSDTNSTGTPFDNDGDGLINCADPDCQDYGACVTTTSTTTSTTESTTSTTDPTTTTTESTTSTTDSTTTTLAPIPCGSMVYPQCAGGACPEGRECAASGQVSVSIEGPVGECVCVTTTTTSSTSTTLSTATTLGGVGSAGSPTGPLSGEKPTCYDGLKNRDEEGVDCGGAFCNPCLRPTTTVVTFQATTTLKKSSSTTLEEIRPIEAFQAETTTTLSSGAPIGYAIYYTPAQQELNWSLSLFLMMCMVGLYFYRTMEPKKAGK